MTIPAANNCYSLREEIANSVSHGVGLLLAITGLVVLAVITGVGGDPWRIVGVSIFGATLVLLYGASTLYHSIPHARVQKLLQNIDHTAIYLLIAGTYTPVMLVNLRGPWGWSIFGVVWGLALLGIAFQYTHLHRMERIRVILYVIMGWTAVVAAVPMLSAIDPRGLALILAGGLAYTGGIGFYAWRRLPYHHAIWHVCVLAGSVCHFFAVLYYVVPTTA